MKKTILLVAMAASLALQGCQQQSAPSEGAGTTVPSDVLTATATPQLSATPQATVTPEAATPQASATPEGPAALLPQFKSAPNAAAGQLVFVPMQSSAEALLKGETNKFSDLRARVFVKAGDESSTVKDTSTRQERQYEAPNALIIEIPAGAKAAVGDIVLAQPKAISATVGIVTEASNPAAPTVHLFKPALMGKQPEGGQYEAKLEPGNFRLLKNPLDPASRVLYPNGDKKEYGQVVKVEGDKVLITDFGGELRAMDKSELTALPIKPSLKKGDKVQAPFGKGLDPATVVKVDEKIGRVWVTFDGRETQGEKIFCFTQVLPG